MFNNVVLDVAIGLIFMYMLYSLLATAINEVVATIFSYRSRMLERGIEQMLDGRNYSYYWWDKVFNWFLYRVQKKKVKNIQGRGNDKNKVNAFFSREKINEESPGLLTQSSDYIVRRKLNKKAALFTTNIRNHPLFKRTAENSLFYKKPAYLKADSFADILLDVLSGQKSTDTGTPVLMKDIAAYVESNFEDNPDLKKILGIYIEQANGDLQRFRLLIENWYDSTMDRVSGWYKKQATKVLLIIGLVLAFAFNVSTIGIVEKLSDSPELREAMVKNASEYVKAHIAQEEEKQAEADSMRKKNATAPSESAKPLPSDATQAQKDSAHKADSIRMANTEANKDSSAITDSASLEKVKKQIAEIKKLYRESIEENNNLLGLGWGDFGYARDSIQFREDSILKDTNEAAYCEKYDRWWRIGCKKLGTRPERRTAVGKVFYILGHGLFNWKNLIGFIITALAISLGAPFWFDLLNKFINIRVSGAKPEDSRKSGEASKTPGLNQQSIKPNPKSFG